ncbi:unnamed protein product [Adineta steineri]|uniref:G-protein coupled receptors family 1 profile domain-containing protein n=1 Tax=Adineta steineri TaxID=433720 RepID=A0A815M2X3_9BILA|nr:unnamed protein product [Adineta steineri]CAF1620128.1 unnamed protein product [Adineta steineri]
MPIPASVRFYTYFPLLIPSIPCSIFILYHLLTNRILRQALNNHVIILILILGLVYELTDVIWLMHYYRVGISLFQIPAFCLIWVFIDLGIFVTITILVAWASIQRHILIFHDKWVSTKRGRLLFHYIPSFLFLVYPIIFYVYIFIIMNCEQPLDYEIMRCGYSYCAFYDPIIGKFDGIVHQIIPTFIIVTFSFLLLVRVLWQKHRLRQRIQWRNYRKMAIQLLSIASIYLFFYFPAMIIYMIIECNVPLSTGALDYYGSTIFFIPHIIMVIPFATIFSLPELQKKLKINILFWKRPAHAVAPRTIGTNRTGNARTAVITQTVK